MAETNFRGELIGKYIEVTKSNNKTLVGLKGKVVDETKNMLLLENGKMVKKNDIWLKIIQGNDILQIDGKILMSRSEDRLKKVAER